MNWYLKNITRHTIVILLHINDPLPCKFYIDSLLQKKKKGLLVLRMLIYVVMAGELKRICETDLGLISQCCLTKHVCKTGKQQYLANVALKINVKVCVLYTIRRILLFSLSLFLSSIICSLVFGFC